MQYFFVYTPMKKTKISLQGGTALFGHQIQNNFFALIKKIFLQTLIEIIFRYHSFFYCICPPYEHNEFFTYEVLGIKIW